MEYEVRVMFEKGVVDWKLEDELDMIKVLL